MEKNLRDYQDTIVSKVCTSDNDVIICLPTGAGKTVIAAALIEELKKNGKTVIFIVPHIELLTQAEEEFGEVDLIWQNKTKITDNNCILASKDSLRTQVEKLKNKENIILIFDEVHIGLEQTYNLCNKIQHERIIGLTATPERMDGKALLKGSDAIHKYGIFDEIIQEETVFSLIKKGYLTKLRYYTKPIENITDIKSDTANGEELSDEQIDAIFSKNNIWGDLVSTYEKYGIDENGKRRPALGFTNTIAMAEKVCEMFVKKGYNFKVIKGEQSVKERKTLIEGLRTGEIDGLINSALLTYGFNCPPVSYAFSCRHIKSRPLWFQIVGRILRLSENKSDAIFIDHGDSISEFSEPGCSLPILSPSIKWRVDGETKTQKMERQRQQKKERASLKILQELDPQPCNMVEVNVDDTWERLINLINRLKNLNESLFKKTISLKAEAKEQEAENKRLKNELKKEKTKLENEKKKDKRFIDPDRTFNFCKKNYCGTRMYIISKIRGWPDYECLSYREKLGYQHDMTVKNLLEKSEKLPFLLDQNVFSRSMNYWERNFTEHY